ncbi:hypothetical protein J1N35_015262 [Gossypium stocksii]|uniref:Uncharacterized protein n=1 Tax=Gossypium stocksii TaxID=47602 RepID=A0A9D3VY01_9ROSI|nr:hypothetical protein J1N35_015262 [Gossypium stocksii]
MEEEEEVGGGGSMCGVVMVVVQQLKEPQKRARLHVKKEIGWKAENGASINIWNDAWLSGLGEGRIRNQNINVNFLKVMDLIEMESFTWNVDVLKLLFSEEQIKRILEIPLVDRSQPDVLLWRCDDSCEYS